MSDETSADYRIPWWVFPAGAVWLTVSFVWNFTQGNHIPAYEIALAVVIAPILVWGGYTQWKQEINDLEVIEDV